MRRVTKINTSKKGIYREGTQQHRPESPSVSVTWHWVGYMQGAQTPPEVHPRMPLVCTGSDQADSVNTSGSDQADGVNTSGSDQTDGVNTSGSDQADLSLIHI